MQIEPYLFFEGRCDEAIAFYTRALGAKQEMLMRYGDAPAGATDGEGCGGPGPQPPADKVMHASLRVGSTLLMLADGFCSGQPDFKGVRLSLSAADDAEAKRLFDALADGGQVEMPLAPSFFASSFGMLTDRFGLGWMVLTSTAPQG